MKSMKRRYLVGAMAAVLVLAGLGAGAGMAMAGGGDDNDQPITGSALQQASAAALASTGGGTVTDTEAGDEEGAYEVEVTLDDGSQVDVHLDANFSVINSSPDGAGDEGGPDDGGAND